MADSNRGFLVAMRPGPTSMVSNRFWENSGLMKTAFVAPSASPALASLLAVSMERSSSTTVFLPLEPRIADNDHEIGMAAIGRCTNLRVIDLQPGGSEPFDMVFVFWSHVLAKQYPPEVAADFTTRFQNAGRVVLLYDSLFGSGVDLAKQQIGLWLRHWRWLVRVERICYVHRPPGLDLFQFSLKKRCAASIGPNIHFLFEAEPRRALYGDWVVEHPRKFRLALTGGTGSAERRRVCEHLRSVLSDQKGANLVFPPTALQASGGANPTVLWGVSDERRPDWREYVQILGESDFTICLPGTYWTHRPMEALARGSIPIIDRENLAMHDIPWRDGENCLIVDQPGQLGSWDAMVLRALWSTEEDVRRMRRALRAIRASHIDADGFNRNSWNRLTA